MPPEPIDDERGESLFLLSVARRAVEVRRQDGRPSPIAVVQARRTGHPLVVEGPEAGPDWSMSAIEQPEGPFDRMFVVGLCGMQDGLQSVLVTGPLDGDRLDVLIEHARSEEGERWMVDHEGMRYLGAAPLRIFAALPTL